MKLMGAVLCLGAALLVGCNNGNTENGNSSPLSAHDATGVLNGTPVGKFNRGFYTYGTSNNGFATTYYITLTQNGMSDCDAVAADPNNVQITAPSTMGDLSGSQVQVAFNYLNPASNFAPTFDFANNGVLQVVPYENGIPDVIKGAVMASAGKSSINGTFVATYCPSVATATSTGATDPSQVQAQVADQPANAKYAFCSIGGVAVLVDFVGANLTQNSTGAVRIATRPCNQLFQYKWMDPGTYQVMMSSNSMMVALTLPTSRLEITGSNTTMTGASGTLNGSSGTCVYLENEGTMGLYPSGQVNSCQ